MAFWETVLGKYIMTMAIAAVPVVELRGAIPAGIAAGLDPWLACGAAIFGNLLPVPFIILLVRQVFDRLRKHAFFAPKIDALERRAHLKGRLVRKYRLLGLMLFVAIPLPGTGAWTGGSDCGLSEHPPAPRSACHHAGTAHCRKSRDPDDAGADPPALTRLAPFSTAGSLLI